MILDQFKHTPILIRGGGDLASGVAYRLFKSGFPILITELPAPLLVRRTVCFGEAVFTGETCVEGVQAIRVNNLSDARDVWLKVNKIPVMIDDSKSIIQELQPKVIVDARMEKQKLDTSIQDAEIVIGLGPGYEAQVDCHAVIETNRGHNLGRVIREGYAEPNTGEPGSVNGKTHSRVLRAPINGHVKSDFAIGDVVEAGQIVAQMGEISIEAAFSGVLRGLIHPDVKIEQGRKIGDLDPRAKREHCFSISDKALAIGGGVLEAILSAPELQEVRQ